MVKNLLANAGDAGDVGSIPELGTSAWRRKWQPISVLLPGKFHRQRSLEGYSLWGSHNSETEHTHTVKSHNKKKKASEVCFSSEALVRVLILPFISDLGKSVILEKSLTSEYKCHNLPTSLLCIIKYSNKVIYVNV